MHGDVTGGARLRRGGPYPDSVDTARGPSASSVAGEDAASVLPLIPAAGVCLHITSLPGEFGIGEIGSGALRFVDTLAAMGMRVWQFLPLGPTAYGDSPYQPLSTFAGNETLLDIGQLVRLGLVREEETATLRGMPAETVDYGSVIPLKNRLLRSAASRFRTGAPADLRTRFEQFVHEHDEAWLHDYAMFRILKARHDDRAWMEWAPEFVHREPEALARLAGNSADELEHIKVLQFLFDMQWRELREYAHERGIELFGDMPICIAFDSADAWANRDLLRVDEDGHPDFVAGVPPDYFSEDGQLWGNPLYDWEKHARNGYRWWINRLRASAELADIVRIDHFRGFEAYWAVPAGAPTAKTGSWLPGPADSLFDALRADLGYLPIVAEDLGVITDEVEALRDRYGIPGMHVLQFDVDDPEFRLDLVPSNSVCYTGTHDNDTTVGWFHGSGNDMRSPQEIQQTREAALALTGGTPETIHTDMIRAAFSTAARIAIAPMQDYLGLGSEARFNTPGSSSGNWRWRLLPGQLGERLVSEIGEMVDRSGRLAPSA